MHRTALSCTAMVCLTIAGVTALNAGPLGPPAGPIAGTYRTLAEVEPRIPVGSATTPGNGTWVYRITQPGSYFLTADVPGVSGKGGIEIAASNVTLDLRGYSLTGVPGSLNGVLATSQSNITVLRGTVRSWGASGVLLSGVAEGRVEHVRALQNGGNGIQCGEHSAVEWCSADFNGVQGIQTAARARVQSCTASGNGATGMQVGNWSIVVDCVANNNASHGIRPGNSCLVQRCQAGVNGGDGISGPNDVSVLDCVAGSNDGNGISVNQGSTVSRCKMSQNDLDGILATSYCSITDNHVMQSGFGAGDGAGIHIASGSVRSHVEGNKVFSSDRGIDVDGTSCVIARNAASGNNTNYVIAANNSIGTIVQATLSGAVNGSTGGSGVGTTNSWSNLSY